MYKPVSSGFLKLLWSLQEIQTDWLVGFPSSNRVLQTREVHNIAVIPSTCNQMLLGYFRPEYDKQMCLFIYIISFSGLKSLIVVLFVPILVAYVVIAASALIKSLPIIK